MCKGPEAGKRWQSQQPYESGEEDQVGDRFKSVHSKMGSFQNSTSYFISNEKSLESSQSSFFFNPFFLSFLQFKLQTAIPHSASGHLTWSTPEILPITADPFLIPPVTGLREQQAWCPQGLVEVWAAMQRLDVFPI